MRNLESEKGNGSWADVVKLNSTHGGMSLNYISPEDDNTVRMMKTDVEEGLEKWRNAVVGLVLGAYPPYTVMKRLVDTKWKEMGKGEVISLKNEAYVFYFSDEESKMKILEQSPWPLRSKMLFWRPWTPGMKLRSVDLNVVPVWIRLPHLKLH